VNEHAVYDEALTEVERMNPKIDVRAAFDNEAAHLATVVQRYQEMLCAAYLVKRGHLPGIAEMNGQNRSFLQPPAPGHTPVSRIVVESRLPPGELDVLAARYRQATALEPEDAVLFLRMAPRSDVGSIGYDCQIGYEPLTEQERMIQGPWPQGGITKANEETK
jgi:hypothetical protein